MPIRKIMEPSLPVSTSLISTTHRHIHGKGQLTWFVINRSYPRWFYYTWALGYTRWNAPNLPLLQTQFDVIADGTSLLSLWNPGEEEDMSQKRYAVFITSESYANFCWTLVCWRRWNKRLEGLCQAAEISYECWAVNTKGGFEAILEDCFDMT